MPIPVIKTPQGSVFVGAKSGKAYLRWNKAFGSKWTRKYRTAQEVHDKKVVDECEPFIPKKTGALILSGKVGTTLGTGQIRWVASYAAYQYFNPRLPADLASAVRGPFWFERMKAVRGRGVIDNTIKIFLRAR